MVSLIDFDTDDPTELQELVLFKEWIDSSIRRVVSGGKEKQARPKLRRVATVWFLRALDHALQQVTSEGLEAFAYTADGLSKSRFVSGTAKFDLGPVLALSADQASVTHGGGNALRYKFDLAEEQLPDTSHRCHNDLLGGLKKSGPWWEATLLDSIHSRVNAGPWQGRPSFASWARLASDIKKCAPWAVLFVLGSFH